MKYNKIDIPLYQWARDKKLNIYTMYKDEEIRSIDIFNKTGTIKCQLWIIPQENNQCEIHIWNYKGEKQGMLKKVFNLPISNLSFALDKAYETIQSWMYMMEPSNKLIGKWVKVNDKYEGDEVSKKIDYMINNKLTLIKTVDNKNKLYYDSRSLEYWELTHLKSKMPIGGPPQLSRVTSQYVEEKYGLIPSVIDLKKPNL